MSELQRERERTDIEIPHLGAHVQRVAIQPTFDPENPLRLTYMGPGVLGPPEEVPSGPDIDRPRLHTQIIQQGGQNNASILDLLVHPETVQSSQQNVTAQLAHQTGWTDTGREHRLTSRTI